MRYYHIHVSLNLFGEYSVRREWGFAGRNGAKAGQSRLSWFGNLKDACLAAERWHLRAADRGYATLTTPKGRSA